MMQGFAFRTIPASLFAAMMTFGLFFTMQAMVAFDLVNLPPAPKYLSFDTVFDQPPPPEVRPVDRLIKAEPVPVPDLPVAPIDTAPAPGTSINISPFEPTISVDDRTAIGGVGRSDGDYLPLVRVQPVYPQRALQRGIEGYVIVSLTVGANGTVAPDSIQIVEQAPSRVFERAAIDAAKRFKYQPKMVGGVPQAVSGVTYKFTFALDD